MSDISTTDVTVGTVDGPMRCYEARPEKASRAVVVVQEAFGVNEHIENVTRRLATAGYHAIAPHLFHRSGPGSVVEYGNFEKVLEYFQDLGGDDAILVDIDAALDYLHTQGFANPSIGIVGFCAGGRVTFLTSVRRALGAGVGFYGGGIVTGRFPQFPPLIAEVGALQTPWMGIFGDEDASIPVEDVEQLRAALADARVPSEIVRYEHAGHGFHCDHRPDFRPEEAADAWARTLAWFDTHLG
jgi:carboxymethylenebutenolidase